MSYRIIFDGVYSEIRLSKEQVDAYEVFNTFEEAKERLVEEMESKKFKKGKYKI